MLKTKIFLKQKPPKIHALFVIAFFFVGIFHNFPSPAQETTRQDIFPILRQKPEIERRLALFENIYPPRVAKFSKDREISLSYTNKEWLNLNIIKQANYIHRMYKELLKVRNLDYSPRVLTCKVFRESVYTYNERKIFQIQKQTSVRNSTASGISQATISTSKDIFNRKVPEKIMASTVPGFENIEDGEEFHDKMAGNMLAQMDLGIMTLRSKQIDTGAQWIRTLLKHYYGHPKKKVNSCYAERILRCAFCIKNNKAILEKCLDKALASSNGC